MTTILGISAFYHDSAAAMVVDGEIIAAAQEERFTRIKHDFSFPANSIAYCLKEARIDVEDIDYIAFYEKPFLKFERLLETYLAFAPAGFLSFMKAMPLWLRQKLHISHEIDKGLGKKYRRKIVYPEHHESHAASAFFPSPFKEAAILTIDGVGEWTTCSFGSGKENKIELTHELKFPHSLGLLYSAFTYLCGFKVNSGEYKLMGLASYGEPKYANLILDNIIDLKDDGSFRLDMSYFKYCQGLRMTSGKMSELLGISPRQPESEFTQQHMDLAASIQKVVEMCLMRIVRHIHIVTGHKNLCMAGGVALNCVSNGRILRESSFEKVWIQPAAGDAGGALGSALFVWYQLLGESRNVIDEDSQKGSLLGPEFSLDEIRSVLDANNVVYEEFKDDDELFVYLVKQIEDEKVIGLMQGRMEFGPRALGNRSIIGDARSQQMQEMINNKIKFRESFRPFAPSVLKEKVHEYFDTLNGFESPYMLFVSSVHNSKMKYQNKEDENLRGFERLKINRSAIPAVTHVDNSARIQTVDPIRHGRYYKLLKKFDDITGCPLIINTSFNVRGEPIVCSPEDALQCFWKTNMDILIIENFLVNKVAQRANSRLKLRESNEIESESF